MPTGERFGLQTRIAATESGILRTGMKSLELESAISWI
jgi:hypothetical protein